jgi:hypothetical protein
MTIVYAFAGRKGSGKSTASQALLDLGFNDLKFADPLKNMLRAFYQTCGLESAEIERRIEGDLKEEPCEWLQGKTPRYAMQTLGTEWREMIATNLWSDIFVKRVRSGKFGDRIVCSDFRFPGHEEAALAELGAYTYRIERPGQEHSDGSDHPSETLIDKLQVRGTFLNSGTIESLQDFIRELVKVNTSLEDVDMDAFELASICDRHG